jgi:hypothetical protein
MGVQDFPITQGFHFAILAGIDHRSDLPFPTFWVTCCISEGLHPRFPNFEILSSLIPWNEIGLGQAILHPTRRLDNRP